MKEILTTLLSRDFRVTFVINANKILLFEINVDFLFPRSGKNKFNHAEIQENEIDSISNACNLNKNSITFSNERERGEKN